MENWAHNEAYERVEAVREAIACCQLCPHDCRVNRRKGQRGLCGLDDSVRVFREMLHHREEGFLSPSHQVYFSGCNLRCEFCSVLEWVEQPQAASPWNIDDLVQTIAQRKAEGAVTLNLLGGEPTVNLQGVLDLLARVPVTTRVVWNSNMYYHQQIHRWLEGLVDVYLADFKCGSPDCAESLLGAHDYVATVQKRISEAVQMGQVIVRVPILPGHRACCLIPTLEWIASCVPGAQVSLRPDYIPPARAQFAPTTYVDDDDRQAAGDIGRALGLKLVK